MKDHANSNAKTFRRVTLLCLLVFFLASAGAFPDDDMTSTVLIGNSRIDVVIEKGTLQVSKEELLKWVQWAAESVSDYYGHFPLPHLLLRIIPTDGRGVRGGKTFGEKGGFISIHVGSDTIFAGLAADWMLTHEMVHLAFPSVADNHHWIEEGIATYVEPIARVRAKHFDATQMWFEVVRDLHQGLPAAGDKGLDNTHTWGRTYWGGALFCFLADIEIHQKTGNRKGLDDALRGILAAGGDIRQEWPLEKALDTGDQATGVSVLRPLYEKMKEQPYDVDLPALWKQLGIERDGETVRFVDDAPLSQTRIAITYGSPASVSKSASAISIIAGDTAMNFPKR
ncbi:MAG TPA: hypothetical protein VN884_06910 [Candidatus Sulfotelmatobacter sp.]|jgi:hypothetical protein|nr:hypothetical protein [Candidatus Sulfotelmatobacter sp.]